MATRESHNFILTLKSILASLYSISIVLEKYYVWLILNLLLLIDSPFQGFEQVSPQNVIGTNPDLIFCIVIFFSLIAFSPCAVAFALNRHPNLEIKTPSLIRCPLNWWIDPLQCLFVSALAATLLALGSIPGFIYHGGLLGYWTMVSDISTALGLWAGIVLVHLIYRNRFQAYKA